MFQNKSAPLGLSGPDTHCGLRLSLVALGFGLKLLDQFLHPQQSLPVLLRLQDTEPMKQRPNRTRTRAAAAGGSDLQRHLLHSPLRVTKALLKLIAPLPLLQQLQLKLPDLQTAETETLEPNTFFYLIIILLN